MERWPRPFTLPTYAQLVEQFPGRRPIPWRGISIRPWLVPAGSVILHRGLRMPRRMRAELLTSLRMDMYVTDDTLIRRAGGTPLGYREALANTLEDEVVPAW